MARSTEEATNIVIVIDLPQTLTTISRLMTAISRLWKYQTIDTNPKQKSVPVKGWLIHIKSPEGEELS